MPTAHRGDIVGRLVGMLVFLVGVALLLIVFHIAYTLFTTPPASALGLKFTGDPKKDPALASVGVQFAWLLFRIACLIIMSVASSMISNKGINLYFSALHGNPVTVVSKAPVTPSAQS